MASIRALLRPLAPLATLRTTLVPVTLRRAGPALRRPALQRPTPSFRPYSMSRPAPPRLPAKDQSEFETLLKQSTGAFSVSKAIKEEQITSLPAEEMHKDLRRGAKPEFEGEKNPKTGEVGGPKNEPLLAGREWTFNGRATDF